jgi:hypothetical protein
MNPDYHASLAIIRCPAILSLGRVEDWRGIPKVRPSLLLPFPYGVPQ